MPHALCQPALALLIALAAPLPVCADTAPDVTADLAAITRKASGDRNLQMILQQLNQMHSRPADARSTLENQLFQSFPNGRLPEDGPVNYRIMEQVQQAQMRAQYYGQILAADLNDDGSISRQEVKDALSIMQIQGAAEALFSLDANDDNTLSPDEIRAAVDRQTTISRGRRGNSAMRLFDFDNDGVLTPQDGMAALGLGDN